MASRNATRAAKVKAKGKSAKTPAARRTGAAGGKARTAPFPRGFSWGVATSAYQIEGAVGEGGRGRSIWDAFSETPGRVIDGGTGVVACDHYHRWREDLALMRRLGAGSYRFSVAWPRVLPGGTGQINEQGLDFYDRLVDGLLRAGITPSCTLYHWDLPVELHARGGWLNRDAAGWFADYASAVVRRLGDRVKLWATLNEPSVVIAHGLQNGSQAPGERRPLPEALLAAHNLLRAHGRGVQALRADGRGGRVGYVVTMQPGLPVGDGAADVEAARTATFRVEPGELWGPGWWLDPVLEGRYPADGLALHRAELPAGWEADLASMRQPLDYIGLNVYTGFRWRAGPAGEPVHVPYPPGYPRSTLSWQWIAPSALYWGPRFLHERTRLPVRLTENGVATCDWPALDGVVHDTVRVDYLRRALLELARAIGDGVPVESYEHWTLLDNFEWSEGYTQRLGLVHVDFETQRRTPKDSFDFYRKLIATRGRSLLGRTALPPGKVD